MIIRLIFFIPLFFIFILEGFGWDKGREIAFFLIVVWPMIIFFYSTLIKKQLIYPKKLTLIYFGFLLFSFISGVFSVNIEESLNYLFYYLAGFILFLYFYNYQKILRIKTVAFFIFLGLVFVGYSFFINYCIPASLWFLIPNRGFQYVYPYYKTHNPLANLLLIPTTMMLVSQPIKNKILNSFIFGLFVFFILISFSRSSYLALSLIILILIVFEKDDFNPKKIFLFVLLVGSFLLTQFSLQEGFLKKTLNLFAKKLSKNIVLESKSLLGNRNEYFRQAILAIRQRPIFGFGPGNFLLASKKFTEGKEGIAGTADNIFLEVFTENGAVAGIFFIVIIFLIIKSSWRAARESGNVNLSLFLALLVMLLVFQIDSVQRFYSYFLSFFIIAGLLYKEKKEKTIYLNFFLFFSLLLLILPLNQYLSQSYLNAGRFRLAIIHNPFNQQTYRSLIDDLISNDKISTANKYLKIYQRLFSGVDEVLEEIANFYERLNNQKQARKFYQETVRVNPLGKLELIIKIYQIDHGLYGKKTAEKNLKENIVQYYLAKNFDQSWRVKGRISRICYEVGYNICRQAGINQPIFFTQPDWDQINKNIPKNISKPNYLINKDKLNEDKNYSIKKPTNVFRIVVLGGSTAFGSYVDTDKNWTTLVEKKLNKIKCQDIKKYEVINLGFPGYDIDYAVYWYKIKGQKYRPDLILWWLNKEDFYKINDLIISVQENLKQEEEKNKRNQSVLKKTNEIFWDLAYNEVKDLLGEEKILKMQREFIDEIKKNYLGKIVFLLSSEPNFAEQNFLGKDLWFALTSHQKSNYRFLTGDLNDDGHQSVADEIIEILVANNLLDCFP